MSKQKDKQAFVEDEPPQQDESKAMAPSTLRVPRRVTSKPSKQTTMPAPITPAAGQSLNISRNKHWRFISSFHGPWLQLPVEVLESIATVNYNSPRPRPIHPGTLFDLVKIRRLVEEATNLAVRAASDLASPVLTSVNGPMSDQMGFLEPGHRSKMSRERKFRMREQASQKLGRAFRLDEVACSVATMQGASALEDVAQMVLQRNENDFDAKYVHFFHEKIPSRQLVECTSLKPLTDIIAGQPGEGEPLRTRAMVKVFRDDHEGAAQDLTRAISLCRFHRPHTPPGAEGESSTLVDLTKARRRPQDVFLAEKDQPRGLYSQLLFHRGTAYLSAACRIVFVEDWMDFSEFEDASSAKKPKRKAEETDEEIRARHMETRKTVKSFAKRALRDFITFLSLIEYSPNVPVDLLTGYTERVNHATNAYRRNGRPGSGAPEPHSVYKVSDLFVNPPPANLPEFPTQEFLALNFPEEEDKETCEYVTYHPLMTDALHSLLLCHALLQTPPKELLRHAYMVARLVRIAEGYPVFQSCRSPSRSDWIVVVRRAENWLKLGTAWNLLCSPNPGRFMDSRPRAEQYKKAAFTNEREPNTGNAAADAAIREERSRAREQALIEAIELDTLYDEKRGIRATRSSGRYIRNGPSPIPDANANDNADAEAGRWSPDDYRDFPLLTPRATAIAEWVRQAPHVPSLSKKKKKGKKSKEAVDEAVDEAMENLDLED